MKVIKTTVLITILNLISVASVIYFRPLFSRGQTVSHAVSSEQTPTPTVPPRVLSKSQTPQKTKSTLSTATPQLTPTPTPTTDTLSLRCLIVIDGVRYDLTDFRKIHSGGDIFVCGSDMSAQFHGQHSESYLSSLDRYRI